MKKKIIATLLVLIISISLFSVPAKAVTLPEFNLYTYNYNEGERVTKEEINEIEVGKTLQLYGLITHGNDIPTDTTPTGIYVDENGLEGITWESSDTKIATVDNTGKVTGISEGKATITAKYKEETAKHEITIKKASSDTENPSIDFTLLTPEPAKIVNTEYGFLLYLTNIPEAEKKNIKVTIEDEKIAKISNIDLCEWEDGSGEGMIIANANLLSKGSTKIKATLSYNGETLKAEKEFDVVESAYTLALSTNEGTTLPKSIEVGKEVKLKVLLETYGGSLLPEDVTSKGTTFNSNNEKVAKVDSNGTIKAVSKGTATITAQYTVGNETIKAEYNITVTDSSKTGEDDTKSPTTTINDDKTISKESYPNTGAQIIILVSILAISLFALLKYIKLKKNKDIK